jgi:hypothetical protein
MKITDGDKVLPLEKLAEHLCYGLTVEDNEACYNGECPAADYCRHGHNGMIDWLRKVLEGVWEE